jgi:hypothetical protein
MLQVELMKSFLSRCRELERGELKFRQNKVFDSSLPPAPNVELQSRFQASAEFAWLGGGDVSIYADHAQLVRNFP